MRFDPRSYAASIRDRVQIDYAGRLSVKEKEWLAAFNETEYGSNPDCLEYITGKKVSVEEKRKFYREIKRYQRDILTAGPRVDLSLCVVFLDGFMASNEDVLIEMIDEEDKLELAVLDSLKFSILSKDWNAYGKAT